MMGIVFDKEDHNGKKVKEYSCNNWFIHFTMENLQLLAKTMCITIVNILAAMIFVKVSENEKNHNSGEENMMVFKFIFVEAFINTGLNPVLQDPTFWKH